jgi:hypothetical protein
MAFAILRVLLRRIEGLSATAEWAELPGPLRQFAAEGERHRQTLHEITEAERPPMATVPEYLARRAALAANTGELEKSR